MRDHDWTHILAGTIGTFAAIKLENLNQVLATLSGTFTAILLGWKVIEKIKSKLRKKKHNAKHRKHIINRSSDAANRVRNEEPYV